MIPDWLDAELASSLARGAAVTVGLTAITSLAAMVIGLSWGITRLTGGKLSQAIAAGAISIFRGVPALIQIIFWAFAVPNLFPASLRGRVFFNNAVMDLLDRLTGLPLPYYALAAALGLTLNTSAYIAELFRAGVATIPQERIEVARTLGASTRAATRTVLLPDGVRAAFPAISTRLVHNMKNTALASFVAVPELFHEMQATITQTFRATELIVLTAIVYLILTAGLSLLLKLVERRLHYGRPTSGQDRIKVIAGG